MSFANKVKLFFLFYTNIYLDSKKCITNKQIFSSLLNGPFIPCISIFQFCKRKHHVEMGASIWYNEPCIRHQHRLKSVPFISFISLRYIGVLSIMIGVVWPDLMLWRFETVLVRARLPSTFVSLSKLKKLVWSVVDIFGVPISEFAFPVNDESISDIGVTVSVVRIRGFKFNARD